MIGRPLVAFILMLSTLALAEASFQRDPSLQAALEGISPDRMAHDIARLSGADFRGRQAGTAADAASALFVADRLSTLGWHRAATDASTPGLMSAPAVVRRMAPDVHVSFEYTTGRSDLEIGPEVLPVLDSPSVQLSGSVVFVGYGISDTRHRWDEYANLDVRDRVVLFLRGQPEGYPVHTSHRDKLQAAKRHGASAFLMCTGPLLSTYDARRGMGSAPLAFYNLAEDDADLPGAWLSTSACQHVLSAGATLRPGGLEEIQRHLNALTPQSREIEAVAHLQWHRTEDIGTIHNVIAVLPGSDPALSQESVLLGAHRDHFGAQAGLTFPGADDNASGTAILLEIARLLGQSTTKPKRSVIVVSFSGEESGLQGSKLYVNQAPWPLEKTVAMVNVDHAGIGNGRLTVGVVALPKEVAANAAARAGLAPLIDLFGFFPGGDHVPFKEAGIPTVAVVSGGAHPHFHQPTDTPETIQPDVLARSARYVLALVWLLANP